MAKHPTSGTKMCGKCKIACSFLTYILVHQGLLLSSPKMDANQIAVEPDIVKMLSIADSSLCNSGVYDNQTSLAYMCTKVA